jgi:hypothetical protein
MPYYADIVERTNEPAFALPDETPSDAPITSGSATSRPSGDT